MKSVTTGLVGWHKQPYRECCANCRFCTILLDGVMNGYFCEIFGEPSDGVYSNIQTDPLAICDLFKLQKITES